MGRFTLISCIVLISSLVYLNQVKAGRQAAKVKEKEPPLYLVDEYALMPSKDKNKDGGEETSPDGSIEIDMDGNQQLGPLTMPWDKLSWKTICDEDEWRKQFRRIRTNLTRCFELTKIILPGEDEDEEIKKTRNWSFMFTDGKGNPYCRLSRNWKSCYKMLEKANCIQPDPEPLLIQKTASGLPKEVQKILPAIKDPDDWLSMHRPYKIHCLVAKQAYGINPFALFGAFGM